MCLTFFYFNNSTNENFPYKFIQVFNREEFFERPNHQLAFWEDDPNILGGRDLKAKGTWLGLNIKTGNIAFLTNLPKRFVEYELKGNISRGDLITGFLRSNFFETKELEPDSLKKATEDYLQKIKQRKEDFMGFNLVLGNLKMGDFWQFSNGKQESAPTKLEEGSYMMTNVPFLEEFKRAVKNFDRFQGLVKQDEVEKTTGDDGAIDKLKDIMENMKRFSIVPILKGLDEDGKVMLTPMSTWGTKSRTVVLVDQENKLKVVETTFNDDQTEKCTIVKEEQL